MVIRKLFEEFDENTIRLYVQKNADYYIAKWRLMATSGSKTSWNWAAFFFTANWMGYRKMYLYAFIYIVLNIATLVPIIGLVLWILLWVGVGVYGNYLYGQKTYESLVKLRNEYPNEEIFKQMLVKHGGTSVFGVILVILMGFIIYAVLAAIGMALLNMTEYSEF
ncbi:MAG: DUF2628 domain-containing protein [Aquificae bacterium]|nr:DUF2628 domain-containing protein [Aquificota bacterium]